MKTVHINKNRVLESHGRSFLCDSYYPESEATLPLLIFVHGYKGYKDWGAWSLMAESIAKMGYYVVTFNFSHNGTTVEKPSEFADLEAFGHNTFIKELEDLNVVIDHFIKHPEVNASQVGLVGHSRGGGICVLKAAEDRRITSLVTLAGVSDFQARMPKGEALKNYLVEGVMYTENKRTGQKLPHYWSYYDSFIENKERLTIKTAAEKLAIPYLILAAEQDEAVKIEESENLHRWCQQSLLKVIPNTSHTFGAKEPWEETDMPNDLALAVQEIISFLKSSFK